MKKCIKCGEVKLLDCFYLRKSSKDGYTNDCKLCISKRRKEWALKNKEYLIEKKKQYYIDNKDIINEKSKIRYKNNPDLYKNKSIEWSNNNKERKANTNLLYRQKNKDKISIKKNEYRLLNKEKIKQYGYKYRDKNKQLIRSNKIEYFNKNKERILSKNRSYRELNSNKLNEKKRLYFKENRHIKNSLSAKRKAQKNNATVKWSNDFFIKEIYELARLKTKMLSTLFHVDHIVPLISPIVCGLHCESNLQVITAKENMSKQNYYWPDMP